MKLRLCTIKKNERRILLEHPNKTRKFAANEIANLSATYKSHRIPVPYETQRLADDLRKLIQYFNLDFYDCNAIIRQEFGEGVGLQNFTYHFLDPVHGVGFNPRKKTLKKYRFLKDTLRDAKKRLAKAEEKPILDTPEEQVKFIDQTQSKWKIPPDPFLENPDAPVERIHLKTKNRQKRK